MHFARISSLWSPTYRLTPKNKARYLLFLNIIPREWPKGTRIAFSVLGKYVSFIIFCSYELKYGFIVLIKWIKIPYTGSEVSVCNLSVQRQERSEGSWILRYEYISKVVWVFSPCGDTVVKVLCYKSEGRWFDPSWCHWIFHWHKILPIALRP